MHCPRRQPPRTPWHSAPPPAHNENRIVSHRQGKDNQNKKATKVTNPFVVVDQDLNLIRSGNNVKQSGHLVHGLQQVGRGLCVVRNNGTFKAQTIKNGDSESTCRTCRGESARHSLGHGDEHQSRQVRGQLLQLTQDSTVGRKCGIHQHCNLMQVTRHSTTHIPNKQAC